MIALIPCFFRSTILLINRHDIMQFSYKNLQWQLCHELIFGVVINRHIKTIICDCILHNLRMIFNSTVKGFSEILAYFCMATALWNMWPQRIAFLIALCFALAASNIWTEVLCLTSNVSANWRIDFVSLGFSVDTYGLGVIRLLPVHHTGVQTIADSIIALCWCWYSRC